jgi:Fe-S cluster biogenesis protein NfuA/nitrite reductase/ring-hydroxylating ferredoxin subunit
MRDGNGGDRIARIERLLDEIDSLGDPVASARATDAVQALLELYGEGLGRILARLPHEEARALAEDELVAHLFVLHGLHPIPLEERVRQALEDVRPYLGSHGGGVELLGVEDGVARLRLEGSCDGCPSSTVTLKLAIEEAILKAAPEIERVEADGVNEPPGPKLLQLESKLGSPAGEWTRVGPVSQIASERPLVKEVAGEPVLFVRLDETPYAYGPLCPACGTGLVDARLEGRVLACPGCGTRFDVRLAGRALDGSGLQLRPVPLLADEAGGIKVALGAGAA